MTSYLRVKEHMKLLQTTPLTEDRLEQYKAHLGFIRLHFPNFVKINIEIQDPEFRKSTIFAEQCMQRLEREFTLKMYYIFLKTFQYIVEYVMEDQELAGLMDIMKL
jgi:hypothetical protein